MPAFPLRLASCGPRCLCSLACLMLLWGSGFCKKKPALPDDYLLLRSVRSPDQLVVSHLPSQYTVPITLSGEIADEMAKTLQGLGLTPPRYEEALDRKQFHLLLANSDYSLETRDLLSGVLNPVEMIDIVVSSALKYRQDDRFLAIANETNITRSSGQFLDKKIFRFVLEPKGNYFAYSYEDMGAYIRESWLSGITCVMDSASHCVYELTLHKCMRTFAADQTQKPPVDSSVLRYSFGYTIFKKALLPVELSLSVNGKTSLTLSATYRGEGRFLVFDTRKICSVNTNVPGSASSCLMMTYGAYEFNKVPTSLIKTIKPGQYVQNMEKAARDSRRALEQLRNGNIEKSVQVLKKMVADYPETPQAVEAKKLLSGLPGGDDAR